MIVEAALCATLFATEPPERMACETAYLRLPSSQAERLVKHCSNETSKLGGRGHEAAAFKACIDKHIWRAYNED